MFEDGEVNAELLYVLFVFTQTYCAEYKDLANRYGGTIV
jgi:hypothetical protein